MVFHNYHLRKSLFMILRLQKTINCLSCPCQLFKYLLQTVEPRKILPCGYYGLSIGALNSLYANICLSSWSISLVIWIFDGLNCFQHNVHPAIFT